MSHLSAFVPSPCTAWRGKVIENSREVEKVVLALPFPQTAVPMHLCLVQFSADRDLQQTNFLCSGTSLAASSGLTAQRLEGAIPIKPLSPLERFLPLKGEKRGSNSTGSKAATFATNKQPAFFSAGASFAPVHSKFSFFFFPLVLSWQLIASSTLSHPILWVTCAALSCSNYEGTNTTCHWFVGC